MRFSSPRRRIKLQEVLVHILIDFNDGSLIPTPVTIIWCREESDAGGWVWVLISLHYELMGSSDQFQAILVIKLFWHVLSECESSTSWGCIETLTILYLWKYNEYHQGHSTINHKEDPHEAPLVFYQAIWCDLNSLLKERGLHEDRISNIFIFWGVLNSQQQLWWVGNQTNQWSISMY